MVTTAKKEGKVIKAPDGGGMYFVAEPERFPEAPISGEYQAKVVVVDNVVDAASGTFGVRLKLPNPGNRIPAGFKCRAHLDGTKPK